MSKQNSDEIKSGNSSENTKPLRLKGWLVALGVLSVALIVLCLLKTNRAVCEFFARTFSRAWVWFFGNILGWIPVSFYELFIVAAVAGAIFALVVIIVNLKRRQGKRALKTVVVVAVFCVGFATVYTSTASVLYNRENIPLGTNEFVVSDDQLEQACEFYVNRLNEVSARLELDDNGIVKNPYTVKELGDKLKADFECLDVFDGFFNGFTPQPKGMVSSFAMSALSLTGITFVPFGEPNVNTQNPARDLPHTMAHEIAHSKGIMREYEANIVANYVCLNSSDDFILYSGLTNTVYDLINLYETQTDEASRKDFYSKIDKAVSDESFAIFAFWINKQSFVSKISEWFNNLYLKLNGQSNGTGSYDEPPIVVVPGEPPVGGEVPVEPPLIEVVSYTRTQRIMLEMYLNQNSETG